MLFDLGFQCSSVRSSDKINFLPILEKFKRRPDLDNLEGKYIAVIWFDAAICFCASTSTLANTA
jgi:hypothetical protein